MRPEKQFLLDDVKDRIDNAKGLVLARYERLDPNLAANFRSLVANSGGSFEVVKKRILIKAAQNSGMSLDRNALNGHIGVIFADEDPVNVTKLVYKFSQENQEVFQVLGGSFEGKICSAADMKEISKLPSKDEMRAQFLGLLVAPLEQTLSTFEALLTSVMHCLENKTQTTT